LRFLLLIISLSVVVLGQNNNIILLENQKVSGTVTSKTTDDIPSKKEYYSLKYYLETEDLLYLIGLSHMPLQTIGNTTLSSFPVEIKQKREKLELAVAYKFYLKGSFYIAPALAYIHTDTKTFQHLNNSGTITSSSSHVVDTDYSLYAVMGYRPTKTSSALLYLELNNDLLSSEYSKDYSSYQLNLSILQAISKNVVLYFQYNTLLKDKPATSSNSGTKDVSGFSVGIGFRF